MEATEITSPLMEFKLEKSELERNIRKLIVDFKHKHPELSALNVNVEVKEPASIGDIWKYDVKVKAIF